MEATETAGITLADKLSFVRVEESGVQYVGVVNEENEDNLTITLSKTHDNVTTSIVHKTNIEPLTDEEIEDFRYLLSTFQEKFSTFIMTLNNDSKFKPYHIKENEALLSMRLEKMLRDNQQTNRNK